MRRFVALFLLSFWLAWPLVVFAQGGDAKTPNPTRPVVDGLAYLLTLLPPALQWVTPIAILVVGYLLRHKGVNLPLLPQSTSAAKIADLERQLAAAPTSINLDMLTDEQILDLRRRLDRKWDAANAPLNEIPK